MKFSSIPLFIAGWYILSAMLGAYNKWLFGKKGHQLSVPLLVTSLHSVIHFSLSILVLYMTGTKINLKPNLNTHHEYERADVPTSNLDTSDTSPLHSTATTPPITTHAAIPWHMPIQVVPCGIATALDIGMSNASLRSLSLSFYTLIKGSTPMWSLFFALLIGVEKPSLRLFIVLGSIFFGLCLSIQHSDDSVFEWTGFYLATLASIMGGLRMILIQIILQSKHLQLDNPFATNMVLSPIMFVTLIPFSALLEPLSTLGTTPFFDSVPHGFHTLGLISLGGVMAFMMICTEYRAVQLTSGLTISVAGILKEIITILVGIVAFGDVFTVMNVIGLMICLSGIFLYNYHKWQLMHHHHVLPSLNGDRDQQQTFSLKECSGSTHLSSTTNEALLQQTPLPGDDNQQQFMFLHDSSESETELADLGTHCVMVADDLLPRKISRSGRQMVSPDDTIRTRSKSRSPQSRSPSMN